MTKIALITNILSPYRTPLFNQLNEVEGNDLTIYLLAQNEKNRLWSMNTNVEFKYKILPDYGFDLSNSIGLVYHFNPSILYEIRKEKFDVVICGGYDSLTALISFVVAKVNKIPFILWSGSTEYESRGFVRLLGKPLIYFFSKYSDAYIAYGTRAKQFLIKNGAPRDKIFEAYNTVDIEYYKTESLKYTNKKTQILNENGIKNEKCVLYVGQLIDRKGLKILLDSFQLLSDELEGVSLLIIGEGKQKEEYINYCSKNNINDVYFLGHKNIEEIPRYYSIADLFVLPSLSEVWGLVLNEAMACGLPVITNDLVGASEDLVMNNINGYVIKAGNVDELKKAMKNILSNDKLKYEMGQKSLDIIDKYSIKHSAEGFVNAINILENKE